MGVIRNLNQNNRNTADDEWLYLSSDGEEVVQNAPLFSANYRKRNQRSKKTTRPEPTFSCLGVKGKSHKKFRRFANANLAMTELGSLADENELETVSIDDFIPQTTSAFALLLQNLDHAADLNSFLNCSEEEQENMFEHEIKLEHCHIVEKLSLNNNSQDNPHHCFLRIDTQIRKQLVKKHVPLGILASVEDKIVHFFNSNPDSLYRVSLECSYQRFLLHACCQYLNLSCQSFDFDGKRISLIKNKTKHFERPLQLLSEYLEMLL